MPTVLLSPIAALDTPEQIFHPYHPKNILVANDSGL
jgi:hypothetical protein